MALTVFLIVTALNHNGFFQALDLKVYDSLRKTQRLDGTFSPHIVVIGIDENDIHKGFHYPILDSELATILQKTLNCGPRVIGVDIYRDIPEERMGMPGRHALSQLWQDHSNIIQVMLFQSDASGHNHIAVDRPPELRDKDDQIGFADDFVFDSDGVARRGLLFEGGPASKKSQEQVTYSSFVWQIASSYLDGESPPLGLQPVPGTDRDFFLGNSRFRRFSPDDGPYVNADAAGIGFLLDCKSDRKFLHLTGSQILSGQFPPGALKDAVVLVGMRAASVKDMITTPTAINEFGVDANAATVDQLLRMAIRNDPQLQYFAKWKRTLWNLLWSAGGGLLGYFVRRPLLQVAGTFAGISLLLLAGSIGFHFARWVPVISPGLSLLAAASLVGAACFVSRARRSPVAQEIVFKSRFVPRCR